jgi:hypothetical protein
LLFVAGIVASGRGCQSLYQVDPVSRSLAVMTVSRRFVLHFTSAVELVLRAMHERLSVVTGCVRQSFTSDVSGPADLVQTQPCNMLENLVEYRSLQGG